MLDIVGMKARTELGPVGHGIATRDAQDFLRAFGQKEFPRPVIVVPETGVGAFDGGVVAGAGQLGVEAFNRRGLSDVEALALRDAVGNVEENDVAQLLEAGEMRQRATNHSRTNECDLVARHESASFAIQI